ncbi:thioredoxin-like protein [Athelia psychrophila]|uniref:glutathione transferase n=1 Tax=Athelia psychrophila TaxID=1759441 RepID=A0A166VHR8_9AGAM|nr:thioredoxin-like protein [Fibularhizoctonia sp. CBS 109695]
MYKALRTSHVFDTTLKLYGTPFYTSTKRVAIVLQEKHVQFEFITIDLIEGENKVPAFVAKQPFEQVPFISDEGFILYESRAIGCYIASKYGVRPLPGPHERPQDGCVV